jgi:hypothetical protein
VLIAGQRRDGLAFHVLVFAGVPDQIGKGEMAIVDQVLNDFAPEKIAK